MTPGCYGLGRFNACIVSGLQNRRLENKFGKQPPTATIFGSSPSNQVGRVVGVDERPMGSALVPLLTHTDRWTDHA